ncbi:growth arrest-specific protein 1b [Tachysurus fulvidraco]|uniref:growth arrest-specific protein 1b n=1 Tax=Tachysurus fulvidraco TaxID=1234273 RepID=UPI001FEF6776|nr:growth arrest-specific protein 1b [Tachysurus fulvidraco]
MHTHTCVQISIFPAWIWIAGLTLVRFGALVVASPAHRHRLICWQAVMKCQSEPECHYAYTQYTRACGSVINGHKKKCPSHCISSIVQLNLTDNGPGLEHCECATDTVCLNAKRAIEPCMPRISHTGCTEARRACEGDAICSAAMRDYMFHCRELFGGERCSDECRRIIMRMRSVPKARLLDTCECDGAERIICEHVKISMNSLCSDAHKHSDTGSGFTDDEDKLEDDYNTGDYEEEDSAGVVSSAHTGLIISSTMLLFTLLQ